MLGFLTRTVGRNSFDLAGVALADLNAIRALFLRSNGSFYSVLGNLIVRFLDLMPERLSSAEINRLSTYCIAPPTLQRCDKAIGKGLGIKFTGMKINLSE